MALIGEGYRVVSAKDRQTQKGNRELSIEVVHPPSGHKCVLKAYGDVPMPEFGDYCSFSVKSIVPWVSSRGVPYVSLILDEFQVVG